MSEIRSQATSGLGLEVVARVQADGLRRTEVLDREGNQLFQMTDCTEAGTEIAEGLATMLNNWTPPPRTVNSATEFDALPVGSVLARNLDHPDEMDVYVKRSDTAGWRYLPLPMAVLFTPGDAG